MQRLAQRAVSILALLTLPAAAPRVDGIRFSWKVTLTAADDAGRNAAPPSMTVTIAGDRMRSDFLSPRPGMGDGAYMLFDAASTTLTLVDPSRKQAMIIDAKGGDGFASMASGLGVKFDVSDVQTSVTDLGAGERILGRSTRKYHISRSYSTSMSVLGRKSTTNTKEETDSWVTNDFAGQRAFDEFGRTMARSTRMIGGNAAAKLNADAEKLPKGVPLKQVVTTTTTSDKGETHTMTTTMEMLDLTSGNFDPSLFAVPAGYQTLDLKAQMAEASKAAERSKADCEAKNGKAGCESAGDVNLDSILAAAKSDAAKNIKDAAKDAAKNALKGLFRKP